MTTFEEDRKIFTERANAVQYCPYCGHSIVFSAQNDKLECNWCHNFVYNKSELGKRKYFKDQYKKARETLKRKGRK